jgi:glycosyltransferase involved in cell wall biosynthesis
MRIAYLNTLGIPAHYGGFETCVEEVSRRLVRKGHDVTVYCASRSSSQHSSYEGVKLIGVPGTSNKFLDFPLRSFLSTADAMSRDFDIFHYYGTDSWIFALLPRVLSRSVVISLDGLVWNRSSYSRWVRAALRATSWAPLYVAHTTVVDSSHVKGWYLKTYGKAPIFIPYGAKISSRNPDLDVLHRFGVKEDGYILFVGRLVPEKGLHHLVKAFNELGTQSKLQLVVVGGNPYGSAYELSLKRMVGENRVRFLGYVYGPDMENLFKGAYLYVTASELEGTSPALLSAMGFGNCALVSDIPENLETIGNAGLTFRSRDVQDLHDKMLYLISQPEFVRTYREKAVERVTALYSWDSVADRMEELYLSLVGNDMSIA